MIQVLKTVGATLTKEYLLLMQPFSMLTRRLFKPAEGRRDPLPSVAGLSPGPETQEALLADKEALDRAAAEFHTAPIIETDGYDQGAD